MLDIIINPTAGKTRSRKSAKMIYNYLKQHNVEHRMHFSEQSKHITELVSKIEAEGGHDIVIMGGDGSFHEALNGISDFKKITLGFIPAGSGNDFAHTMKLSSDPIKALEDILANNRGRIDYIKCGNIKSLNIIATGLDTDVLYRYNKAKIFRGKLAYFLSLLGVLLKFKFYNLELLVDGQKINGEFMLAACCNGTRFGGSMPVSPRSDIKDGKINLILIHKVKKIKIPFLLFKFLKGKHLSCNWASELICERVKIKTLDRKELLESDGEIYEDIPFETEIMAGGLKVFLPSKEISEIESELSRDESPE